MRGWFDVLVTAAHQSSSQLSIRARTPSDVPACAEILVRTHRQDGYPRYAEHANADFVGSPAELAAWVAVLDDRVVGHVALHRAADDLVSELGRAATGLDQDELVVLARLVVSPKARGRQVGARLVELAVGEARRRGLRAVLDVVQDSEPAWRLYERLGWRRIGFGAVPVPGHPPLLVYVYLSPAI